MLVRFQPNNNYVSCLIFKFKKAISAKKIGSSLVEQFTCNENAIGSIPIQIKWLCSTPTNNIKAHTAINRVMAHQTFTLAIKSLVKIKCPFASLFDGMDIYFYLLYN